MGFPEDMLAAMYMGTFNPFRRTTNDMRYAESRAQQQAMMGQSMGLPVGYVRSSYPDFRPIPERRKHQMEYKVGFDVIDGHVLITVGCKQRIVHKHSEMMSALHQLATEELEGKIFKPNGTLIRDGKNKPKT